MVAYKVINTLVGGMLGLGFSFIILGEFVQQYSDNVDPTLIALGWSQFGAQNQDVVRYAVENMPSVGLVFLALGAIVWAANYA